MLYIYVIYIYVIYICYIYIYMLYRYICYIDICHIYIYIIYIYVIYIYIIPPPLTLEYLGGGRTRNLSEIFHLTAWNIPTPHMFLGFQKEWGGSLRMPHFSPGETIKNQILLAEIFLGLGSATPPFWNISVFTPPTSPLKGGLYIHIYIYKTCIYIYVIYIWFIYIYMVYVNIYIYIIVGIYIYINNMWNCVSFFLVMTTSGWLETHFWDAFFVHSVTMEGRWQSVKTSSRQDLKWRFSEGAKGFN